MAADTEKHWEADLTDCPSTTAPKLVCKLYGGESITIKSEAATGEYHFIGPYNSVSNSKGFKLWGGETMSIDLRATFGMNNIIKIWALPETAGADITFFKVKISNVEGLAELENLKKSLV